MILETIKKRVLSGVSLLLIVIFAAFFYKKLANRQVQNRDRAELFCPHDDSLFFIQRDVVTTPYGTFIVKEKVFFDLIQSAAMQRIRKVHQFGVAKWIMNLPDFSRFTHSLGVWALLRRFGAPLNEQLAGLLHDVSHTAFSHTGDVVFNHTSLTNSYQDDIHEWFLRKYGVDKILAHHGIVLRDVLHKNDEFKALEQKLPDLCADRIEYNLHEGLQLGLITLGDVKKILEDLRFENGQWFFVSKNSAKRFARLPFYYAQNTWGSAAYGVLDMWAAQAIRRALELHVITLDEFHFSTDDVVWGRLMNAADPIIKENLTKMRNLKNLYTLVEDAAQADLIKKRKFSGVNPVVRIDGELKRLTEVDSDFAVEYEAVKKIMHNGWKIKFIGLGDKSAVVA